MRKQMILLRKDITLDKIYMIVIIVLSIGIPIYIAHTFYNMGFQKGVDFVSFFLSTFYCFFMALSNLGMIEHKYRGIAYFTLTTITRKDIVLSKYIFVLFLFFVSLFGYEVAYLVVPFVGQLSLTAIVSVWTANVLFLGFYIPLEIKFGFENVKYYFTAIIVVSPLLLGLLGKYGTISLFNDLMNGMKNILIAFAIISMILILGSYYISIRIFCNKDL